MSQVGLTVPQQLRLQQILAAGHRQAQSILTNPALSEEQQRIALKQMRGAAEPQILAMLTPAQRQKLAAIKQATMIAAFNRGFDWIATLIARGELSDTQKARMQQILVTAQNQAAALLANHALSEEQRLIAFKQLYGATQQQMESVLTLDQQKKLAEIKQSLSH